MRSKRTRSKRSRKTTVSTAVKKYVKRVTAPLKPEVKRYIDYYNETGIDSVITPYQIYEFINNQGTGPQNRIGTDLTLIGLNIKAWVKNNATTTQFIRALVLSCASDTDTTPSTMELFKDANLAGNPGAIVSSGTSSVNVLYPVNDAKFKVHYDKVVKLGATTATGGEDVRMVKRFLKFRTKIHFDAASIGGTGNASRRFFVLFLTTDPVLDGAGGAMEISGQNTWYFTDA